MTSRARKVLTGFFAVAFALICAFSTSTAAYAAEPANLALKKEVTVSAAPYDTLPASALTDGNASTRWSAEAGPEQWAYVDLKTSTKVARVKLTWESDTEHATDFKLYVSDSTENWGDPVATVTGNNSAVSDVTLDKPATGRYIKLVVTKVSHYPSVSCGEMEVYGEAGSTDPEAPEAKNLALKKTTKASKDYHNLNGARAVDGKKKDKKQDRWMTEAGPVQWLAVDLTKSESIKYFDLLWEDNDNYATKFKVYVTDNAAAWENPASNDAWGTAVVDESNNTKGENKITLDTPATGRYIKLEILGMSSSWGVSLMEFEAWNEVPPAPEKEPADYLNDIKISPVTAETKTLQYELPEAPEGYEIKYNGTDYEQVIDTDGTIYRPITNVTVKASFKITNKTDHTDYAFKEFEVAVPGTMTAAENANVAPTILPELREWVGGTGSFAASSAKRVVYSHDSLKAMADEFASDFQVITGVKPSVSKGTSAAAGDIFFTLTADKTKGLKDEGYIVEAMGDKITVTAEQVAGANWGGKTILQGMKTGEGSFPVGTARDYPLFKVRGLMLDVGRKTFTMDWLQQLTKQMAWFKLNDFHVHLNDNYIPLEQYNSEDVFQAYNAFRLESDIKKGGNGGLNKADLTATDVWYTKAEFKQFIEDSAALGVNIIPEIDTPAHSLALTKVRPDLRHGTSGRQNDHLNLTTKYDQSLAFVTSIFDEYVKGGDQAVFADADVIHIGADEYSANGDAYRKFVNDMFKYAEDNGKTARVWGSLTSIKGSVDVQGVSETGKHRQMNLWNPGWADMKSMYDLGFDLIDCQDGVFYIVPNATYYYDYLGDAAYNDSLNGISGYTIPAGDPQMIGGAFAVWNDMCDRQENGMSEYDIYKRINHSAGLFGGNGWGKGALNVADAKAVIEKLGDAPNTNFGYDVAATDEGTIAQWNMDDLSDASGLKRNLAAGKNAAIEKVDGRNALKLNGKESYVSVKDDALTTVGLGNDLRIKVKRTSASTDAQVLFESEYGQIMAVQEGTGKVGITRENHAYSFDYALPVNDWVELEFKNTFEKTELWVNGELVDTVGTNARGKLKATSMFPVNVIGSKTNAFQGYVDDVRVSTAKDFNSTMELDYAVVTAETVLKDKEIAGMRELLDQAYDIFKQMNPSAEAVSSLTARIVDALNKADYEKADYCRIEAYAQLQRGGANEALMALFTADSVQALQSAWSQVREGLPASMQSTVDGYESAIVKALDGMKTSPARNLSYIDQSKLQATANKAQDGQGPDKALDGDASTYWHTTWGNDNAKLPHWIELSAKDGSSMMVDGIAYTPRPDAGNGTATAYKVEVTTDGKTYTKVAEGKLEANAETKTITFDKVEAKKVRFVITKAAGNFGSAAEINLSDATAKGDFAGLQALVTDAKAVKKDLSDCTHDVFTDETWNALQTAIAAAEESINAGTADVNAVHNLKVNLGKAMLALRLGDGEQPPAPEQVNKAALQAKYDEVKDLKAEDYKSAGWKAFDAARTEAKKVLDDAQATQQQVDAALKALTDARAALQPVEKVSFSDVDKGTAHGADIAWLAANGISKGWDNGDGTFSFRPYETVKRCDMAAFLYRLAGSPKVDASKAIGFADVEADTPHRDAILWMAAEGISTGWGEGASREFRPYAEIARCDMAEFLYRMAGSPKADASKAIGFADVDAGTPHRDAVLWMAAEGISTGWGEGSSREFRPYAQVARCDMAAFLHRMDEKGLVK